MRTLPSSGSSPALAAGFASAMMHVVATRAAAAVAFSPLSGLDADALNSSSILRMICMWRGSMASMRLRGHFSSASGRTVWFV